MKRMASYASCCMSAALFFGTMTTQVHAEDGWGIGAGLDGNGGSIYVPIRVSSWFIEPRLSYSRFKDKDDGGGTYTVTYSDPLDPGYSRTEEVQLELERTTVELGVGVFGTDRLLDAMEIYYGARAGYVKNKQVNEYTSVSADDDSVSTYSDEQERNQSGYFIAPALGVQYFFHARFSVGIEVALRYEKLTGDDDSNGTSVSDVGTGNGSNSGDAETVSFDTRTHAVIRAMF
jgi:hypothetical protein